MRKMLAFASLAVVFSVAPASADQGGFTNSGGTLATTTVANPPGTLTIVGQGLTFTSTDGTTIINATFSTSSTVESCSGGGRGGNVTCVFTFTGNFSGTLTVNGAPQAINGSTYQVYGTTGTIISGTTGYNSAYTPFYFSNTGQILRSDDLNGTNLISYGTQGSGVGQFYGAYGIALDAAGRIYVADTYNDRIVRIDDMNGANWTTFGTYGSAAGQFNNPQGISIDAAGRIYVMDTGNDRLVRMDDMSGTNWTVFSGVGSGAGQLAQYVASVAFDPSGRIYIADTGNKRIVRMDDMNGTNWTTLTQSPDMGGYIFSFGSPIGVAVDAVGRIYVADTNVSASVVRVDDMTGANWTSIVLNGGATPHSIAVDGSGMVLLGGGGAQIVDNMDAALFSSAQLTQSYGPYYVFGATPAPVPSPLPAAVSFTPSTLTFSQNVGTTSPVQTVSITNFGGTALHGLNVSSAGTFSETNDCPAVLDAGSTCTVSVTFMPLAAGAASGALYVSDDSGNMGAAQVVALSGTGTKPAAAVTPSPLYFAPQIAGTTSIARGILVQSTGTGPLQVTNITVTAPFHQVNDCGAPIAPGASCTIQVTFAPTAVGVASGGVTIATNAGAQTVTVAGYGSAPVVVSATRVYFGIFAVGSISPARTLTVVNRRSVPITFSSISASGPFAIVSNTCTPGLAAGASCSIAVTYNPVATGLATGVLTLTDGAVTSPQRVGLIGYGQP